MKKNLDITLAQSVIIDLFEAREARFNDYMSGRDDEYSQEESGRAHSFLTSLTGVRDDIVDVISALNLPQVLEFVGYKQDSGEHDGFIDGFTAALLILATHVEIDPVE